MVHRPATPKTSSDGLDVAFVVRRSDLLWMYLGSTGAMVSAVPGLVMLIVMVVGLPSAGPRLTDYPLLASAFVGLTLLGPIGTAFALIGMYGGGRLVGKRVDLRIDGSGVHGWPIAPDMERTWSKIGLARRNRGVLTLPFQESVRLRAGWVPIPERALTPEQLAQLRGFLAWRGLMKPMKPEPRGTGRNDR
jgi:hypothetical protein